MARTKSQPQRRRELLDAAAEVLTERGIGALTVDEVTSRGQVAKGTFYLYFRGKEDLLAGLRERFVADVVARQEAVMAECAPDDWTGRVEAWLVAALSCYPEHGSMHDALFHHHGPPGQIQTGASPENSHLGQLCELLERGMAAGAWQLPSPAATAVLLYSAMHGAGDYSLHDPTRPGLEELTAALRSLCRAALSPPDLGGGQERG